MEFVGDDFDDYFFEREGELQIEQAGYVNVASGILLITDPIFINEDWQNEEYIDLRLYKDIETNKVYQYQKDFNNYEEKIGSIGQTVNELIKINRFVKIKIERDYNYSFAGSSYATLDNNGYGELQFSKGGEGAGIALDTAFGDGMFPVYIEKYNDRNIRAYINLI